nr:MAG TPA: hypothetical protein [Caudoviricetes sp.]
MTLTFKRLLMTTMSISKKRATAQIEGQGIPL